jgi:hypothetical protein
MVFTESLAFSRKVYEILCEEELISLEYRLLLTPDAGDRKQARAWKAKTDAAKVRHELNLTQDAFAELLVSATVRKWERGTGEHLAAVARRPLPRRAQLLRAQPCGRAAR